MLAGSRGPASTFSSWHFFQFAHPRGESFRKPLVSAFLHGPILPLRHPQVYSSTMRSDIKARCLAVLAKAIHFLPAEPLQELLRALPISGFLAILLHTSARGHA